MKELKDCLLPSHSVEIEVEGEGNESPIQLKTLVEQGLINGQFRVLAPMVDGKVFLFSDTKNVTVGYTYPDGNHLKLMQVPCKIKKKGLVSDIPVLTLEVAGEATYANRRNAFRVHMTNRVVFRDAQGAIREMITKDISLTGMFAITTKKLHVGDSIEIFWHFEKGEDVLNDETFVRESFEMSDTLKAFKENGDSNLLEETAEQYIRRREREESEESCFILEGTVLSCNYNEDSLRYEVRIKYGDISDAYSKRILQFLYKKQSEIIASDPMMEKRFEKYFANSHSMRELPLPKTVLFASLVSLILTLVAVIFFMESVPEGSSFMDALLDVQRITKWSKTEAQIAIALEVMALIIELAALLFKISYVREGKNKWKYSWVLISLVEFLFIVFMIVSYVVNV